MRPGNAPSPATSWFTRRQAALGARPGHDPQRQGYSQQPGYDPQHDAEARLRGLATNPKLGRSDRGWLKQEIRRVDRNRSLYPVENGSTADTLRPPPGLTLSQKPGRDLLHGYGRQHADLRNATPEPPTSSSSSPYQ